jgi:pyruvate dehydrogenase E1 component alpha subunit
LKSGCIGENTSGDIPGFIHLYTGEEAIAAGRQ